MPLISSVITMLCTSSYPTHMDACTHALEAASKNVQIYQYSEKTEGYVMSEAKNNSENYLGKQATDIIAATGFLYKTYKTKSVKFKLPTLGICDSVSNTLTPSSYTLNFKWNISW